MSTATYPPGGITDPFTPGDGTQNITGDLAVSGDILVDDVKAFTATGNIRMLDSDGNVLATFVDSGTATTSQLTMNTNSTISGSTNNGNLTLRAGESAGGSGAIQIIGGSASSVPVRILDGAAVIADGDATFGWRLAAGLPLQFADGNVYIAETGTNDFLFNAAGSDFKFSADGGSTATLTMSISGSGFTTFDKGCTFGSGIGATSIWDYASATVTATPLAATGWTFDVPSSKGYFFKVNNSQKAQIASTGIATFVGIIHTPVDLSTGTDIDASVGSIFYASLSGDKTYTISNLSEGQTIGVKIVMSGSHTVTWPTTLWTGGDPGAITGTYWYTFTKVDSDILSSAAVAAGT